VDARPTGRAARHGRIRRPQRQHTDRRDAAGDDSYGFFDDAPAADQERRCLGPLRRRTRRIVAPVPAADAAWGLFEDAPAAPPAAPQRHRGDGRLPRLFCRPSDATGERAVAPAPTLATDGPAPALTVAPPAVERRDGERGDRRAAPRGGATESSIRVDIPKVDKLINLVGELVITQAMLAQSASVLDPVQFERLHNGLAQLERNTRDMQESVMSIRMMPISVVFSRFPRVVRDLAQKLNKQIELKTIGEGTELDKGLIERIADPLTHLVRNSLDHGIEMPGRAHGQGQIGRSATSRSRPTIRAATSSSRSPTTAPVSIRPRILSKARERGFNGQ
jgi:two-component system chemotaxis sensor kinase CheA